MVSSPSNGFNLLALTFLRSASMSLRVSKLSFWRATMHYLKYLRLEFEHRRFLSFFMKPYLQLWRADCEKKQPCNIYCHSTDPLDPSGLAVAIVF